MSVKQYFRDICTKKLTSLRNTEHLHVREKLCIKTEFVYLLDNLINIF